MADKKHFPWNLNPTPEEAAFWRRWLYRRAAELFEENGEPVEAAECWVGAGFPDRAVELYVREGAFRTAADVLLAEKRTEEALSLCEVWRENARPEDVQAIVGSELGIAACLVRLKRHKAEAMERRNAALELVRSAAELPAPALARCWEHVGWHGHWTGRHDLVCLSVARTLRAYGESHPKERLESAKRMREWTRPNRTLTQTLDFWIGEWKAAAEQGDRPDKLTNNLGMEFVWIPPGTFWMGSPEDEPGRWDDEKRHEVTLTRGYWLQTTPVTQRQYEAVTGENPSHFQEAGPDAPVERVSWEDAQAFVEKLNEREGRPIYRLPTEAEWERGCRAGTEAALYCGPIEIFGERNAPALDSIAWYGGNSGVDYNGHDSSGCEERQYPSEKSGTHPVGRKDPNPWGLYDMLGNVNEWCADWFEAEYPDGPLMDPLGPDSGEGRVFRGGSWDVIARNCRAASRDGGHPGYRIDDVGFRLLREAP
jgi:formylglycine-generating enzyme required for sulfatase activity